MSTQIVENAFLWGPIQQTRCLPIAVSLRADGSRTQDTLAEQVADQPKPGFVFFRRKPRATGSPPTRARIVWAQGLSEKLELRQIAESVLRHASLHFTRDMEIVPTHAALIPTEGATCVAQRGRQECWDAGVSAAATATISRASLRSLGRIIASRAALRSDV